ncbi:MAG: undecaprenyl/decaprenyl-phosphate alpha-N-acetylglucosaminyl 1-phosphate transferase [Planctomycetota bacterium]|nr:MAG: undecaprenyl/decaprenyl-phosphate alpha-N-acetylglucosaminyl 1-phosphate transferase [Planctomycetota bacterium]
MAACLLAGTFVTSAVLTAVVRKLALRTGFVARPAEDRFHDSIVPLGGGIAVYWTMALFVLGGACAVKFLVAPGFADWLGESVTVHAEGFLDKLGGLIIVMVVALALHAVGLWDDRKHLGPGVKLIVQFAAAVIAAFFADIRLEFFIQNKLVTSALSAVWIVLIINAFNFLDNMDGLSAGIAVITSAVLFVAAALSGQVFVGAMALVFIGSLCGFLLFNFPPAKIFMGDSGSLVVGFFVALLTLRTTYYHEGQGGGLYAVFMPLVVMAVPLYDFISVTFLRLRQGKSPFVGDTQHFSHRLQRRGLTEAQTVLTLYLATICTCVGAIFLKDVDLAGAVLIFAQTVMILAIIAILETTGN